MNQQEHKSLTINFTEFHEISIEKRSALNRSAISLQKQKSNLNNF